LNNLVKHDSFWTQTIDAVNQPSISPFVKFLMAQKCLCYGVSFSALQDNYQMGDSTARLCVSKLIGDIVNAMRLQMSTFIIFLT
jgi:hypothetical protein